MDNIKKIIRDDLLEELGKGFIPQVDKVLMRVFIKENISSTSEGKGLYLNLKSEFEDLLDGGSLSPFISSTLEEIIIHGAQGVQFKDKGEYKRIDGIFKEQIDLDLFLNFQLAKNKISFNYQQPFVSFSCQLWGRETRMTLTHPSLSPHSCTQVYIRIKKEEIFSIQAFQLSQVQRDALEKLVEEKSNFLICGPCGSGKTTLLNTLEGFMNPNEHILVLEDVHEINFKNLENCSYLLAAQKPGKTLKDYCSYAMRMSPDRMILGEIRSSETVPFLLSMNSGHKGLFSTLHAQTPVEAINRLTMLFCLYSDSQEVGFNMVQKLICQSLDHLIFMDKKQVVKIVRVLSSGQGTPYFEDIA